jgi:excisionase family DNA binding protein
MDYRDPDWVAEQLGLDRNTVYRYLQDGVIPAVQLGRKWLISEETLEQWLSDEQDRQTRARRAAAESIRRTSTRMDSFSEELRQVVRAAHAEARRYGHRQLGQHHLLLGIAATPQSAAWGVLMAMGLSAEGVREAFENRFEPGDGTPPRRLARTEDARKTMRLGARTSLEAGASEASSSALLVGLAELGHGAGVDLLADMGIDLNELKRRAAGA